MRLRLPGLVLLLALPTVAAGAADPATNAGPVDFDRDVRPILAQHCYECHGPDKSKGGLRLDQATAIGRPGKSGKVAITAGHADQSELIRRVTTTDADDRMPPEKERLTSVQVATLGSWINQGAKFETHWAYRPIARPAPPTVKDERWVRGDIDRFVLATLEARMIAPSPEADRRTLIKRLSYDLVGLPPDPADVVTFVADASPDAYEKLIDRLLASPHFGERWARHWLDLARYADSDGYEKDSPRPDAWRYRDWVIDAINRDVPFDQFTVEQLAGDLLPNATYSQKLATAFHRQTLTNKEGGVDQEQFRVEATFDRAETTGTVWLGLTVGCARCHTHKYDAITHAEYYQLFAFFNDADEADIPVSQAAPTPGQSARATPEAPPRIPPNANPAKPVAKTAAAAKNSVRVMAQRPAPRDTHILSRGDFLRPEAEAAITPGHFSVLSASPALNRQSAMGNRQSRLDLARWLTSPANPLTPRVAVNHVWAKLFGKGLVRTTNDFGVRGERPSHPELLDYLASEYPRLKWSRKALIRQIVLSATYRQSSAHRPELLEVDPENRLLARQNRVRVEGEIVRDVTLAAAGLLSEKVGGPSVFPPMPADVAALSYANNFKWTTSTGDDRYRRGMYTFFKRTAPHPSLITFDCPDANATTTERPVSNTPLQALVMLNSESFHEAAQGLAGRVLKQGLKDDRARVAYAFEVCTARPPTPDEASELMRVLTTARTWYGSRDEEAKKASGKHVNATTASAGAAWVTVARVILNLDEVVTRE